MNSTGMKDEENSVTKAWHENRPLESDPGRALAAELADSPADAHEIVRGALEGLLYIDCLAADLPVDGAATLRDTYLRGYAAAAIVVDAALGDREFTSARDFAVGGDAVTFLPLGATLGMVAQASSALTQAPWVAKELSAWWPEPEKEFQVAVDQLRDRAAQAARVKMRGSV